MRVRIATPVVASVLAAGALATGAGVTATTLATGASAAPVSGSLSSLAGPSTPDDDASISVHVVNETGDTMYYQGGEVQDGTFSDAPWQAIRPHSTEDITVLSNGNHGVAVNLDYDLSNGVTHRGVTLHANDYQGNLNTVGTHAHAGIGTLHTTDAGYPNAAFTFHVSDNG
ncbi:hypothetical protein [Tomitella fengzijianii]|uniref:Uncharacterized protein n=1 Tax=Tomitella fengzijianii TaxID=2597660 RepID=A0A516X5X2_9ACTN|nr:hypothetical protein [Tomitella fengzijianii]QDQ98459.1 hypothetical protein FO059_15445 [Tomitella fengzijianii]